MAAKARLLRGELQKQRHKTKLCTKYMRGDCLFGATCAFAHSSTEMQSKPDMRKTQLCKAFSKGVCTDNDCRFAHGNSELRGPTPRCVWNDKGFCRDGAQCRFVHEIDELRTDNLSSVESVELGLGAEAHPELQRIQSGPNLIGASSNNIASQPSESTASASNAEPCGTGDGGNTNVSNSDHRSGNKSTSSEYVYNGDNGGSIANDVSSGDKISKSKKKREERVRRAEVQKQRYKTKFCTNHMRGCCHFGADCAFAHSLNEMHSKPDVRKTQLCKAFLKGRCTNSDCDFAHGNSELKGPTTLCFWNEKGFCREGAQCRFAHDMDQLRSKGGMSFVELVALGLGAEAHPELKPMQPDRKLVGSSSSNIASQPSESTASASTDEPCGNGDGGNTSGSNSDHCSGNNSASSEFL